MHIEIKLLRRLILLLILLSVTIRLLSAGVILYQDSHIPVSDNYLDRMLNVWDYVNDMPDVRHLIVWNYAIVVFTFYKISELFSEDLQARIQMIEFFIIFINGLAIIHGVEKLLYYIAKKERLYQQDDLLFEAIIFTLTLFWFFNIWSISSIWRCFWPYIFHYCFLPYLVYAFLKCVDATSITNVSQLVFIGFFASMGYTIPFSLFFDFIIIFVLSIAFSLRLRNVFLMSPALMLTLLPFLFVIFNNTNKVVASVSGIISIGSIGSLLKYNSPDLLRGIAITGYPPFYNEPILHWYLNMPAFNEKIYILLFVLLLLAPFIITKTGLKDPLIYVFFIFLVFLTFMCSINTPFAGMIRIFFDIPLFQTLRSTFMRFGEHMLLLALIIFFVSWTRLNQPTSNKHIFNKILVSIILILFITISTLPPVISLVSYSAFNGYSESPIPPLLTNIPEEYKYMLNYLKSFSEENYNKNIIIISIPSDISMREHIFSFPFVSLSSYGRKIDGRNDNELAKKIVTNLGKELSSPYVIIYYRDALLKRENDEVRSLYALSVSDDYLIPAKKAINAHSLFVLRKNNSRSKFYIFEDQNELHNMQQKLNCHNYTNLQFSLNNIWNSSEWLKKSNSLETPEDLYLESPEGFRSGIEVRDFKRIGPVSWSLNTSSQWPFLLSFAESYDPSWEAKIYKNLELVDSVGSIPVYGTTNGFLINTTGKNLNIIINYLPQKQFELGLLITSVIYLSLFVIFLLSLLFKLGSQ